MAEKRFSDYAILLRPGDDVAVLKKPVKAGTALVREGEVFQIKELIAAGHKMAVQPVAAGSAVKKYGQIIGFAQRTIEPGELVHTHNLVLKEFSRDYAF